MKTHFYFSPLLSLTGLLLFATTDARAAQKTWTSAVSGNWSDNTKWTPVGMPASGDDVAITVAGTTNYTVMLDTNATLASLTLGAGSGATTQTLLIKSAQTGTLTSGSVITSNGVLAFTGGTLAGAGILTNQGTIDCQNGTLNSPMINQGLVAFRGQSAVGGLFQNTAGSTNRVLRDGSGGIVRVTFASGFTNHGVIEFTSTASGTVDWYVNNGALVNAPGGLINSAVGASGNRQFNGELDNRGTVIVGQALVFIKSDGHSINGGTINITGGDFSLQQASGTFTNGGTVNIANGRVWTIGGGTLTNGGTLLGPGTLFVDHASASLISNFTTETTSLQLDGATIHGPGTITNVTGKTLDCLASAINAPLINQGTIVFHGQSGLGGSFQNTAGSTNRVLRDTGGIVRVTSSSGFTNNGVIELTSTVGGGTADWYVNSGTMVNAPGALISVLPGAGGTRQITAELDNRGTLTLDYALTINKPTPPAARHTNSGTINITGGDFTLSQSGAGAALTNSGTVNIASGRVWNVNGGSLENGGAILGPGTLNVDHATANLTPNFSTAITGLQLDTAVINGPGTVTNVAGKTLDCFFSTINAPLINQGLLIFRGQCGLGGSFQNTTASTNRVLRDSTGGFSGVTGTGGFTNNGLIEITSSVAVGAVYWDVDNGTLINAPSGQINILAGSGGTRQMTTEFDNRGTLNLDAALTINKSSARHTNSGTINVTGGDLTLSQSGGTAVLTNTGVINIGAGRKFVVSGGTLQNLQPGIVQGFGTLDVVNSALTNAGNFNPGTSPGTLTVAGNFPQVASGQLNIELGGTNQGTQYDFLNVSNAVTLGGSLNVRFLNGFQVLASSNDVFTVLRAGSLTGVFTNVANGSRLFTSDGFGSFIVTYSAATKTVVLSSFEPILPVTADFDGAPLEGTVPFAVSFTNLTSGTAGTYLWDFGDGATSSVINPSHSYNDSGIYTVSLRANGLGGTNTLTKTNLIIAHCALTCPTNMVVSTAPGQCGATVNYPPATTFGGCGSLTFNPPSGSFLPKGVTIVTVTNNSDVGCSFTVTVQDRELPAITCPADIVRSTDPGRCSASNVTFTVNVTDNCPGVSVLNTPASGSTFSKGTNIVTCRATDAAGNTNTCTFKIIVRDTQPPAIACPNNLVFNANPGRCSRSNITFTVTATDNCDTSVAVQTTPPSGATFPVGVTTVQCLATDDDGNTNTCSFTVTVRDAEAPAITCPANFTLQANPGQPTRSNVTFSSMATDVCDGSVTVTCNPPSGSTFPVGATQVRCTAADSAGNSNACTFTVTITAAPITISGRVTNCVTGTGLANVRVRATGVSHPVMTDGAGAYLFPSVPVANTVSVSPEFPSSAFTPGTATFTRPTNNLIVNFCAALQLSISGSVRDGNGLAVPGTTMRLTGTVTNNMTTDSRGAYTFRNVPGGNLTITPTNRSWIFTPVSQSLANITTNQTANFTGFFPVTNLPGRILLSGRPGGTYTGPSTLVINDDGSGSPTPLGPAAPTGFGDGGHAWTKDGSRIAFIRWIGPYATTAIFTMNADGTGLRQLTADNPPSGAISWSPDGSQIAYHSSGGYPGKITVMNADGSNPHILVHEATGGLAWSPDGRRIAFIRDTKPVEKIQGGRIFTVSTNGTDLVQVNTLAIDDISGLSWSPDGTRFGYSAWRNVPHSGPQYISIVGTNGGTPSLTLSNVATLGGSEPLCWSPDSSRILFHRFGNLYTTKPDGTDARLLIRNRRLSSFQSWGPQTTVPTAQGLNITAQSGSASLTFSNVVTPGDTAVIPLPSQSPVLPQGYFNVSGYGTFDVVSSATFSGPIVITFQVPTVTNANAFARLRILHGENGALVDRTILAPDSPAPDFAAHTISARVPSLSPFAVGEQFVAALPRIAGKVVDGNGVPLSDVNVMLSGDSGGATVSDIDGQFAFPNVATNGNYTVSVTAQGYVFEPTSMDLAGITNNADLLFVGAVAPVPKLSIAPDSRFQNQPTLTWPGGLFDFVLESTVSLSNPNWVAEPGVGQLVEEGIAVPLLPAEGERYFRLRRP